MPAIFGALACAVALMACTHPAVTEAVTGPVPMARGAECRAACASLGMQLTSVVLIMNSAGCVCQVTTPGVSTRDGAAAAAGGMAIAAMRAAEEQSAEEQRRHEEEENAKRQRDDDDKRRQEDDERHRQTF